MLLTWYIPAPGIGVQEQVYVIPEDRDFAPVRCSVYAGKVPDHASANLALDIQDDGTSIFLVKPYLVKGNNHTDGGELSPALILGGSIITLKVEETGGAKAVTVTLELTEE